MGTFFSGLMSSWAFTGVKVNNVFYKIFKYTLMITCFSVRRVKEILESFDSTRAA